MLSNGKKVIAICSADTCEEHSIQFLRALNETAKEFPFKILFFSCFSPLHFMEKHDLGESRIFQLINYNIVDAVIMLAETFKNDHSRNTIAEHALEHNVPVVAIEHPIEGCYNILYEYRDTLKELIFHLIDEHHYQKINFIAGFKDNSFSEERIQIYKDALTERNIPIEEERIGYGNFWIEPTRKVVHDFIDSGLPFPDAIVCANDSMAIATIQTLTKAGYHIPIDVAVTGFDGIEEALVHVPPITTIRYDFEATARQAYQLIMDVFDEKNPPKTSKISMVINYGRTCGCSFHDGKTSSELVRSLYDRIDRSSQFTEKQISMAADLTDNSSFHGVFSNLMRYGDTFGISRYWLCIVDNFLNESEELSDIIAGVSVSRSHYSDHMDMMLSQIDGSWQGMTDFNTADLLPKFEETIEANDNLMFLPLHVLDHTIGYLCIVYEPEQLNLTFLYQLVMNISNALETTKIRQRQETIISSLENKYIHDPMTGLLNRRGFYQKVEPLFKHCTQKQESILIASVDLNGLKIINDTYGHADGDIAISTVGQALIHTGENTICARFGGDEFVAALLSEHPDDSETFRQSILDYLNDFNGKSNKPYEVSASIGIVNAAPTEEMDLDTFIKQADERMYEEKAQHHLRRQN